MTPPPARAHAPGINYPWLLAIVALVALVVTKGFEREEPSSPEPVGPPGEPAMGAQFLVRAKVGGAEIGNAFAASVAGHPEPIVLTAMHRFGPAGGLMRVPGAATAASAAKELTLHTITGVPIDTPTIQRLDLEATASPAADIAAFSTPGGSLTAARLSTTFPDIGSIIWLAIPGDSTVPDTLRAEIFAADPSAGLFYFRIPDGALTLEQANAHTGAPLLDLKGEVLGIHLGAAKDSEQSPPYGLGQAAAKFLPGLLQALEIQAADATMATTEPAEPE